MRDAPGGENTRTGLRLWGVEFPGANNLGSLISDRGTEGGERLAALIPVDPAGPDRYRGRAKPWESYALGKRAWRTAE